MNGYKAFAFPTKITNCPRFVTSSQIGDKIYKISSTLAQGVRKLLNRQYFSKCAPTIPQNPSKSSMTGYKAFAFPTKITNYPQFVTSSQIGDKIYKIS